MNKAVGRQSPIRLRRIAHIFVAYGLLELAATIHAQPLTILSPPRVGTQPNVTLVAVDQARSGTLSEVHNLLAFCHEGKDPEAHVSLVKLDAKGQPAAYATSWKLPPLPKGLEKGGQFATCAAFHPKLPLLYVWQDTGHGWGIPTNHKIPGITDIEHLLIYRLGKEPPELVATLCRGPKIQFGVSGGSLAIDPAGEFLCVPNLVTPKTGFIHAGRFRLDADGLPIVEDADVKLPLAERVKKIAKLTQEGKAVPDEAQQTPTEYVYIFPMNAWGCGHSMHFWNKDTILVGSVRGVLSWRPGDPVVKGHHLPVASHNHTQLGLHPTLPLIYATRVGTDSLYRIEHVDGYLSMIPHQITIPETRLASAPVVFEKGKKLAVGGHHHLYLLDLDDAGRATSGVTKLPVLNPQTRVLTYSSKYDRLYVAVEVSK